MESIIKKRIVQLPVKRIMAVLLSMLILFSTYTAVDFFTDTETAGEVVSEEVLGEPIDETGGHGGEGGEGPVLGPQPGEGTDPEGGTETVTPPCGVSTCECEDCDGECGCEPGAPADPTEPVDTTEPEETEEICKREECQCETCLGEDGDCAELGACTDTCVCEECECYTCECSQCRPVNLPACGFADCLCEDCLNGICECEECGEDCVCAIPLMFAPSMGIAPTSTGLSGPPAFVEVTYKPGSTIDISTLNPGDYGDGWHFRDFWYNDLIVWDDWNGLSYGDIGYGDLGMWVADPNANNWFDSGHYVLNIDAGANLTITGTYTTGDRHINVYPGAQTNITLKDLNLECDDLFLYYEPLGDNEEFLEYNGGNYIEDTDKPVYGTSSPIMINTGANVVIKLDGESILEAGADHAGIQVMPGAYLTIEGLGELESTGGEHGAGIGGGFNTGSGTIHIKNGNIIATGGISGGAGIGGGSDKAAGPIIIDDGNITAIAITGGAAGLGGGNPGTSTSITINGGTIRAISESSVGIGGGSVSESQGSFTLTGGIVYTNSIHPNVIPQYTNGILFIGDIGTVYGNVVLEEDLVIKSGETLNIPNGATLTVPSGKKITNNGTVNIKSGGKLIIDGGTPKGEFINNSGATVNIDGANGDTPPGMMVSEGTTTNNGDINNQGEFYGPKPIEPNDVYSFNDGKHIGLSRVIDLRKTTGTASHMGYGWELAGNIYTIKDGADVIVVGQSPSGNPWQLSVPSNATAKITLGGKGTIIEEDDASESYDETAVMNNLPAGTAALTLGAGSDVTLVLSSGTDTTQSNTLGGSGISIPSTASLTIQGSGILSTPGIGASDGGAIDIEGGNITVTSAGIKSGNDITISGGSVRVTSGGISTGTSGDIEISAGSVTVVSGGITGRDIDITGGTTTVSSGGIKGSNIKISASNKTEVTGGIDAGSSGSVLIYSSANVETSSGGITGATVTIEDSAEVKSGGAIGGASSTVTISDDAVVTVTSGGIGGASSTVTIQDNADVNSTGTIGGSGATVYISDDAYVVTAGGSGAGLSGTLDLSGGYVYATSTGSQGINGALTMSGNATVFTSSLSDSNASNTSTKTGGILVTPVTGSNTTTWYADSHTMPARVVVPNGYTLTVHGTVAAGAGYQKTLTIPADCDFTNSGTIIPQNGSTINANISATSPNKINGANVSTPVIDSETTTPVLSVTIKSDLLADTYSNGVLQSILYGWAVASGSTIPTAPTSWGSPGQDTFTVGSGGFPSLSGDQSYYFFAKSVGNSNYNDGELSGPMKYESPKYSWTVTPTGDTVSLSAEYGYGAGTVKQTFTVTNTGNRPIGSLNIGNTNATYFTASSYLIDGTTISQIPVGASAEVTVTALPGRGANTTPYTTTITFSGGGGVDNIIKTVNFTVTKAAGSGISLVPNVPATTNVTTNESTITVTGTLQSATGQQVQYGYSTTDSSSGVTWLTTTGSPGDSGIPFDVTGLSPGTTYYIWAKSVNGANHNDGTPVSTDPIVTPSYVLTMSPDTSPQDLGAAPAFSSTGTAYSGQTYAKTFEIKNDGNQHLNITTLSLTGTDSGSFKIYDSSNAEITSATGTLPAGQTLTIKVWPNNSLPVGEYEAVLNVTGVHTGAGYEKEFTVTLTFEVTAASGWGVTNPAEPSIPDRTTGTIVVNSSFLLNSNPGNQIIEFAVVPYSGGTIPSAPSTGWNEGTCITAQPHTCATDTCINFRYTATGLNEYTQYYFFARAKENGTTHATGTAATSNTAFRTLDGTPPTGLIEITGWTETFDDNLTGRIYTMFTKTAVEVTITAEDTGVAAGAGGNSGIKSIEWAISDSPTLIPSTGWTLATAPAGSLSYSTNFTINPARKGYIFARITDNASPANVTYINSDGIVVFNESTSTTTTVNYTKYSTAGSTATVALNGNSVKEILVGTTTLTPGSDYTINTTTGVITFTTTFLNSLSVTDGAAPHTITINYNPMGETFTSGGSNVAPTATTITLNIKPAPLTITGFDIPERSYMIGNRTVFSADLDAGIANLTFVENLPGVDQLTVDTSGITGATYASEWPGEHTITFTGTFGISGSPSVAANYTVVQPTNVKGTIREGFELRRAPNEGYDLSELHPDQVQFPGEPHYHYKVTDTDANGWISGGVFVIYAAPGYKIILANEITSDISKWSDYITVIGDGISDTVEFYICKYDELTSSIVEISRKGIEKFLIDNIPPTATVRYGRRGEFREFLDDITFGMFLHDSGISVTLIADDTHDGKYSAASGVAKVEYYAPLEPVGGYSSLRGLVGIESEFANLDWQELEPFDKDTYSFVIGSTSIVYARLTDKAGNVAIMLDNGVFVSWTYIPPEGEPEPRVKADRPYIPKPEEEETTKPEDILGEKDPPNGNGYGTPEPGPGEPPVTPPPTESDTKEGYKVPWWWWLLLLLLILLSIRLYFILRKKKEDEEEETDGPGGAFLDGTDIDGGSGTGAGNSGADDTGAGSAGAGSAGAGSAGAGSSTGADGADGSGVTDKGDSAKPESTAGDNKTESK